MRAERLALPLVAALLLAPAPAARAQGLTGYVQGQYQVFEENLPRADGTFEKQRVERWVQTVDFRHFAMPRNDLRVMSSFRLTDLAYRGLADRSHNPQGSLQIVHPWANLLASYRPATVTGGFGATGFAAPGDSGRARTFTSRTQETLLSGQLAPPSWPHLDVAWTRRHRDRDEIAPDEASVNRLARASWSNERLNVYSSIGDQYAERSGVRQPNRQRNASAGGLLHLAPATGANVDLNYDMNDTRVGDRKATTGAFRTHNATLNAGYRRPGPSAWSGSWNFRRSEQRGAFGATTEDHEGTLQYSYDPQGPLRLIGASGARTVRDAGRREFAKSLSAVASLDGRVRTGWTGVATLTHITNWEPSRGRWSVEAARLASVMSLARGLECAGDLQLSTNDDTTLRAVRATTEANARARFTPWPALSAGWMARLSRYGGGFAPGTGNVARASAWDARWRPLRTLELTGQTARSQAATGGSATTNAAGLRWSPQPRLQLLADWSKSSDVRATTGAQPVNGREIATAHVLALLTPKLQLDATAGVADRGGPRENRQATLTLTWAFGR